MGAQVLIRNRVGVDRLAKNNEIAGFKFATVGVIYAVSSPSRSSSCGRNSATPKPPWRTKPARPRRSFATRQGKEPEALAVRTALANYLKAAIEDEWPAMAREAESPVAERALNSLYAAAIALNRSGTRGAADMAEVFRQLDNVTAARRVRLHLATGLVPNVIWIVLFMGALLTVGFTLFFGSENLLAQISMTGRAVGARHHGAGRDHLHRPSFHRPGLHPSRRAGPRSRGLPTAKMSFRPTSLHHQRPGVANSTRAPSGSRM